MKPNYTDIDELIKRRLPTASKDRMERSSARVLKQLRSEKGWNRDHSELPRAATPIPEQSSAEAAPVNLRFVLAAAAVLLAIVIPLYWHLPGVRQGATVADDAQLLEEIQAGVSRSVPKVMEPLLEPYSQPAQGEAR